MILSKDTTFGLFLQLLLFQDGESLPRRDLLRIGFISMGNTETGDEPMLGVVTVVVECLLVRVLASALTLSLIFS